jgi:hypothetical protein
MTGAGFVSTTTGAGLVSTTVTGAISLGFATTDGGASTTGFAGACTAGAASTAVLGAAAPVIVPWAAPAALGIDGLLSGGASGADCAFTGNGAGGFAAGILTGVGAGFTSAAR